MVEAADGNGVFVADLAAERTRLGEANVVRFARGPPAHDAGLGCDIFAVLLVAKPDRFDGDARRRPSGFCGRMIGAAAEASIVSAKACPPGRSTPSSFANSTSSFGHRRRWFER